MIVLLIFDVLLILSSLFNLVNDIYDSFYLCKTILLLYYFSLYKHACSLFVTFSEFWQSALLTTNITQDITALHSSFVHPVIVIMESIMGNYLQGIQWQCQMDPIMSERG